MISYYKDDFLLHKDNFINDLGYDQYENLQYESESRIKSVQNRLFMDHFNYVTKNSRFYRHLYKLKGVDLNDIKTLDDIIKLPFTEKSDICSDFICVDNKEIVDLSLTSGTSGAAPTIVPLTSQDLARLAFNEKIAFKIAGITNHDTMLICAAIDKCFMAGLAYFLGGVRLGAKMVRAGSNDAAQTWEMIKLTGSTVVVGVPSLMYKIGKYAVKNNENPAQCSVKKLIAIGEPVRNRDMQLIPVAEKLEKMWDAEVYSTYASSEIATTFCECGHRQGGHVRPELNIVEIVDEKGKRVKDGETGEVVTTPLGITGMPLIRFRTGDISFIIHDKCECGRSTKRLGPIIGRKNQMLKYKGTTVFPNSIIAALEGESGFHSGYVEVKKNDDGTDRIIVYAAIADSDSFCSNIDATEWIREKLRSKIRVSPEVKIISKQNADNKIYQFNKKRKRQIFFDLRN